MNRLCLQVHGDGGCTEKRDFLSGTCVAEAARVLTRARGRGRRPSDPPISLTGKGENASHRISR